MNNEATIEQTDPKAIEATSANESPTQPPATITIGNVTYGIEPLDPATIEAAKRQIPRGKTGIIRAAGLACEGLPLAMQRMIVESAIAAHMRSLALPSASDALRWLAEDPDGVVFLISRTARAGEHKPTTDEVSAALATLEPEDIVRLIDAAFVRTSSPTA